jgi:hypothetical protein
MGRQPAAAAKQIAEALSDTAPLRAIVLPRYMTRHTRNSFRRHSRTRAQSARNPLRWDRFSVGVPSSSRPQESSAPVHRMFGRFQSVDSRNPIACPPCFSLLDTGARRISSAIHICPVGRRPIVCSHFILAEHASSRTIDLAIRENMATAARLYRPALYCSSTKPSARRATTIVLRLSCRLLWRQTFGSR